MSLVLFICPFSFSFYQEVLCLSLCFFWRWVSNTVANSMRLIVFVVWSVDASKGINTLLFLEISYVCTYYQEVGQGFVCWALPQKASWPFSFWSKDNESPGNVRDKVELYQHNVVDWLEPRQTIEHKHDSSESLRGQSFTLVTSCCFSPSKEKYTGKTGYCSIFLSTEGLGNHQGIQGRTCLADGVFW